METSKRSPNHVDEAQSARKQGGWITFPFLGGCMLGLGVAVAGATGNLIVYLINEFNVKSIDAAQISNIIAGCISAAPVVGAVISDAFFGCYPVVAVSTIISLLSTILFTLTAVLPSLRPPACMPGSGSCIPASAGQLAMLYAAVGLVAVGAGGTRFNAMSFGACQFDRVKDQDVFINWFFVIMYGSSIIGATVIVYVQDSISWGLGFGLCAMANAASVALLLAGGRYYRRPRAEGSPFTGLVRVVVAAVRKRNIAMLPEGSEYYYGTGDDVVAPAPASLGPTQSFRFLNRAALVAGGDTHTDGTTASRWSLCTVKQVEDLKILIRITPLWTSSLFLSVSIGTQISLSVLQALTLDRSLSTHFTLPAGSLPVSSFAAVVIILPVLDRFLLPMTHRFIGRATTPLQRVGVGHVLNTAAMGVSALVERRRAGIVHRAAAAVRPGWVVPMSVLWLVVPLVLSGAGEAMHFPGQMALYYQEFPKELKNTATGVVALLMAAGFYLSTAMIDVVRRATDWLPDDINASHLENVYWMLAAGGAINFGYYLVCAWLYEYQNVVEENPSRLGETDSRENKEGICETELPPSTTKQQQKDLI